MIKISKNDKIGRVIQINKGIKYFLNENYTVVQTFGQPLENTILCTDKHGLKTVLLSNIKKDVVIFNISTLFVDEEMIRWMRMFVCTGRNLIVFAFESKKFWYCDKFILDISIKKSDCICF